MWRRILPLLPQGAIPAAICLYLLLVLLIDGGGWYYGWKPQILPLQQAGYILLMTMSVAYGLYRVGGFHPIFQYEYREWIKSTPWRFGKPLPFGPVAVTIQDLVFVAVLTGLSLLHEQSTPYDVPSTFLTTYVLGLACAALIIGFFTHAYVIAFGLGFLLMFREAPWAGLIVLTGLYVVGWHALQESLRRFDEWDDGWLADQAFFKFDVTKMQEAAQQKILGWPFDRLSPKRFPVKFTQEAVVAFAALLGWWTYVLARFMPAREEEALLGIVAGITIYAVPGRLAFYLIGYAPPISFLGRFRTGRLIIPGYDYVFLAPLAVLICGPGLAAYAAWQEWDPKLVAPVIIFLETFLIFQGPSIDAWRLTGHHRMVAAASLQFQKKELEQTQ